MTSYRFIDYLLFSSYLYLAYMWHFLIVIFAAGQLINRNKHIKTFKGIQVFLPISFSLHFTLLYYNVIGVIE